MELFCFIQLHSLCAVAIDYWIEQRFVSYIPCINLPSLSLIITSQLSYHCLHKSYPQAQEWGGKKVNQSFLHEGNKKPIQLPSFYPRWRTHPIPSSPMLYMPISEILISIKNGILFQRLDAEPLKSAVESCLQLPTASFPCFSQERRLREKCN